MRDRPAPEECANCGAKIPRGAKACPECGADEQTGWRETSSYDGIDLPASAFDEDENSRETRSDNRVNGIAWYWYFIAMLVIAAFVLALMRR